MAWSPDEYLRNADWTKRTWDLQQREFMAYMRATGRKIEQFRQTPVYLFAVERGLIVGDEWKG